MLDLSQKTNFSSAAPAAYLYGTVKARTGAYSWMHCNKQHLYSQLDFIINSQRLLLATQKTTLGSNVRQNGLILVICRIILDRKWECKVGDRIGSHTLAGKVTTTNWGSWTGRVKSLKRKLSSFSASTRPNIIRLVWLI
jgi:hypothetical protein